MSIDGDADMSDDRMSLTGASRGQMSGMTPQQSCGGAFNNGRFTMKRQ